MPHRERKPKSDRQKRPGLTPATRAKKALEEVVLPFRVLIAVHRPRYRGRAGRAAQITSWDVVSLLNKQDPVGICSKAPSPPDILILSGDFGRQKNLAIFRAVQPFRDKGMVLIGIVDDCTEAPEGFPESIPAQLCDICLPPPYRTMEIRKILTDLYTKKTGKAAPAPTHASNEPNLEEED